MLVVKHAFLITVGFLLMVVISACSASTRTGPGAMQSSPPEAAATARPAQTLLTRTSSAASGEPNAAGGGSSTPMLISLSSLSALQVTVTIVPNPNGTYSFSPMTLSVPVGTIVTWQNITSVPQTVTSDDGTFASSGTIPPGGTFTVTFTQAGSYAYHCTMYPDMTGTIRVL
jgi:plastocyanin